jgi:hypothetical protein
VPAQRLDRRVAFDHAIGFEVELHALEPAMLAELHAALTKIQEDARRWNKSLATLRREHQMRQSVASSARGMGASHPNLTIDAPERKTA